MPWVRGDTAPDKPLPNSHHQLRAFNESRKAWRVAIAALEFFALIPPSDGPATAMKAVITAANAEANDNGNNNANASSDADATGLTGKEGGLSLTGEGGLSPEALDELRASFDAFDADKSGNISSAELHQK
jgi:ABC-type microcin C transport system permease subunit YejB